MTPRLPRLPLYCFSGLWCLSKQGQLLPLWTSTTLIFGCCLLHRPREQHNDNRRTFTPSYWCIFSFIHYVRTITASVHMRAWRHLSSFLWHSCYSVCSEFHKNGAILSYKWRETLRKQRPVLKRRIWAPMHERALPASFFLRSEGICKCPCTLNSNDVSALWAHARWWWIQLVSHC